ncbi:histidine phosphatase family protein [Paenibacillus harenae]|uniref:histidine phosphatase family protein n=1 Tax=Paenibacillus harenae TaxID=306543 RepID=UPI002791C430|nr:histidine phosphatase family protein [Paenibacillus harenae]MDQ0058173.1 putative phosphoglycerate mutase [Paenibacillus harenae]
MLIGFVRHGQTDWNALGRIQGQTDTPLNGNGIKQADALAERLRGETKMWDLVVSSDLQRAYTTAKIIADRLEIPLAAGDGRLRERCFGEAEGLTKEERVTRWGDDWDTAAIGIETDAQMMERGLSALKELSIQYGNRNVLIVSHGSFLALLLQELCSGLGDERLGNLSYSILEYKDGNWTPLLHNCTRHLGPDLE